MKTKKIDTGISSKHATNWTVGEAMREIVQNWIDVRREFDCTGSIVWLDGFASVKDGGPGMQMQHLAFGESQKAAGSIGQFGEGLKSALIVLARNGRKVEIRTMGKVISPTIEMSENFQTETLHFNLTDMPARLMARWTGTSIRVQCSREELDAGKAYFSQFKPRSEYVKFQWIEKGTISLPGGSVYVSGSEVARIPGAIYSYHLVSNAAKKAISRDRNNMDMAVAEEEIARLLSLTGSVRVIEAMIHNAINDGGAWEGRLQLSVYPRRAKVWRKIWNQRAGKSAVIACNSSNDAQAEYRHRTPISLPWNFKHFMIEVGVPTSDSIFATKAARPSVGKVGVRSLTSEESSNLKWAVRMVRKYYAEPGKVIVATHLSQLIQSAIEPNGVWNPSKNAIYLRRNILSDRTQTLHTLLHEVVHKVSGANDLTNEFQHALLNVAVQIIEKRTAKKEA